LFTARCPALARVFQSAAADLFNQKLAYLFFYFE
jgi:hypothetical protein